MIIIIDTNILIRACLNEKKEISKLVRNHTGNIDFLIPEYALEEINKHKLVLCKNTDYSIVQFDRLLYQCCKKSSIFLVQIFQLIFFNKMRSLPEISILMTKPLFRFQLLLMH